MATLLPPSAPAWMATDLRAWRVRLGWTQARTAASLCYHLEAYKRLEGGTRGIAARTRRLCLLVEREHVRTLYAVTGSGQGRQVYSTPERAAERLAGIEARGGMVARGHRRAVYLSLFSGLGACSGAMERIGADTICAGYADTNPAANALQRFRWPDVPRLGNIADIDWSPLRGMIDILVGGPPCQPFSVAGKRLGLSDPRGNLALHYMRAVGTILPRWFVFENVPGLISVNDSADFGVLLDAVEELGYACAWRILDARGFGLPQRRRRLWLVGERAGSGSGPLETLALPSGDRRSSAPRAKTRRGRWKADARRTEGSPDEDSAVDWSEASAWLQERNTAAPCTNTLPFEARNITAFRPHQGPDARSEGASSTKAPTLAAASGGNRIPAIAYTMAADLRHGTLGSVASTLQVGPSGWSVNAQPFAVHPDETGRTIVRRFSVLECERLQGLDDNWTAGARIGGKPLSDEERHQLLGNSWSIPVVAWIFERLLAHHHSVPADQLPARRPGGEPPP